MNCIIMFVILLSIHSTGLFNLFHRGDEIGVVGIFDLIRFAPTKKENRTTIAPPQNTPNRHTNTASPHVYPFPNLNVGVVRCCRCCRMFHCCSQWHGCVHSGRSHCSLESPYTPMQSHQNNNDVTRNTLTGLNRGGYSGDEGLERERNVTAVYQGAEPVDVEQLLSIAVAPRLTRMITRVAEQIKSTHRLTCTSWTMDMWRMSHMHSISALISHERTGCIIFAKTIGNWYWKDEQVTRQCFRIT